MKNEGKTNARSNTVQKKKVSNRQKPEYKVYQKYLRSNQFAEVKSIVHQRDNNKCVCCNREAVDKISLQVHHITYDKLGIGGQEEAETCILLCNICHNAISKAKGNLNRWSDKSPILNNLK